MNAYAPAIEALERELAAVEALAPIHERHELERRCELSGLEGSCARVELAGLMACDRIRAYAAEMLSGVRS